jgi:hypothetical protein
LLAFGTYTDHFTPVVLLALNTGLRRGELFNFRGTDIDLVRNPRPGAPLLAHPENRAAEVARPVTVTSAVHHCRTTGAR